MRTRSDRLARRIAGIADTRVRETYNLGLVPAVFYRLARHAHWLYHVAWETDRAVRKVFQ